MKGYQLGLYEKAMPSFLTWREKLQCAGQAGFDYVEISIDETDDRLSRLDWSAGERQQLVSQMEETGVPVRSMCLSGHRKYPLGSHDEATRQRGMDIMAKAVRLAEDLGVRRYVTEMWYTGSDSWKEDIAFANGMMSAILNRQK